MLRQIYTICSPLTPVQQQSHRPDELNPILPIDLLARARELDAKHRAATGRPISRDTLRAQMRIGRDRADAIVALVRAEVGAERESRCPRAA